MNIKKSVKRTEKKIVKATKKHPKRTIIVSGLIGGAVAFVADKVTMHFINKGNDIKDDEDDNKDNKKK